MYDTVCTHVARLIFRKAIQGDGGGPGSSSPSHRRRRLRNSSITQAPPLLTSKAIRLYLGRAATSKSKSYLQRKSISYSDVSLDDPFNSCHVQPQPGLFGPRRPHGHGLGVWRTRLCSKGSQEPPVDAASKETATAIGRLQTEVETSHETQEAGTHESAQR